MSEGIDYSRTPTNNWNALAAAFKSSGKTFVGRYAVNDKSPNGRGISAAEYQAMRAAGIDVFLYWESSEGWMRGGYAAGTVAAVNAQNNITEAGMPADTPVYFACDYDAPEEDQWRIEETLRGCVAVLGFERVGLYAGYWPLLRAKQNNAARWFCQTLAWSGGNLMEGVHLYQYDTNGNYIAGVDCDLVRAYQENYGQAGYAPVEPAEPAKPPTPKPAPINWKPGDVGIVQYHGEPVYTLLAEVTCARATLPRVAASVKKGKNSYGPNIEPGDKCKVVGTLNSPWYFWDKGDGTYPRISRSSFYPALPRPRDAS